jgi:hypothetical protein
MTNRKTVRNIRIGVEACVAVTLILLALPAIGHAFSVLNYRVVAGLFLFVALIAVARDPRLATRVTELLRNKRSHPNGI